MEPSLFEPSNPSRLKDATAFVETLMLGEVALALCVIAVAVWGLLMLTGRFQARRAIRVVLGVFVLLGSPMIAAGFLGGAQLDRTTTPNILPSDQVEPVPLRDVPPANTDPYAGA